MLSYRFKTVSPARTQVSNNLGKKCDSPEACHRVDCACADSSPRDVSHMSPSGGSCTVRVRRLRLGTWVRRLPKGLELGLLGVLPLLIQLVRLGREQTLLGCKQASKRVSKQASKRVSKRVSKRMSKYVRKYVRKVRVVVVRVSRGTASA